MSGAIELLQNKAVTTEAAAFDGYDQKAIERFKAYHHRNPHIFKLFFAKAEQIRGTGRKKYGAKTIMESIRWDSDLRSHEEDFKISNTYTALYARLLAWKFPEYADFFDFKPVRGIK